MQDGATLDQAAAQLGITRETVRVHLRRLRAMQRAGVALNRGADSLPVRDPVLTRRRYPVGKRRSTKSEGCTRRRYPVGKRRSRKSSIEHRRGYPLGNRAACDPKTTMEREQRAM